MAPTRAQAASEESIYKLIPVPTIEQAKQPLHRSKYSPTIPPTATTFTTIGSIANVSGSVDSVVSPRKAHAQFGPKQSHTSNPLQYLKKTDRILPDPLQNENGGFTYNDQRKPALDHYNPTYVPAATNSLSNPNAPNYIHENMLAVIMADSKKPSNNNVDYLNKKDFGKIPAYLNDVKQQIESEKAYIRSMLQHQSTASHSATPTLRLLPEGDRQQMLNTLKQQWQTVNGEYQTLTHLTVLDPRKMKRKEELEARLESLEGCIEKLNKPQVYVQEEGFSV